LELPDELIRELEIRAVVQGRTLKDLVAEFIRQGLGLPRIESGTSTNSSKIAIDADGLPVIPCRPRSRRRKLTVDQSLKLEREAEQRDALNRAGLAR